MQRERSAMGKKRLHKLSSIHNLHLSIHSVRLDMSQCVATTVDLSPGSMHHHHLRMRIEITCLPLQAMGVDPMSHHRRSRLYISPARLQCVEIVSYNTLVWSFRHKPYPLGIAGCIAAAYIPCGIGGAIIAYHYLNTVIRSVLRKHALYSLRYGVLLIIGQYDNRYIGPGHGRSDFSISAHSCAATGSRISLQRPDGPLGAELHIAPCCRDRASVPHKFLRFGIAGEEQARVVVD